MEKNKENLEIERKFLIEIPNDTELFSMPDYEVSQIEQTYLLAEGKITRRVRKRVKNGKTVYTKTEKRFVSPLVSEEYENEISEREYEQALMQRDTSLSPVKKTRKAFSFEGHTVEIDVYPFWDKVAVLEVELKSEDEKILLPSFIKIIREVTAEKEFKNRQIAEKIPDLKI
jgi:CYTH domain-containing protein